MPFTEILPDRARGTQGCHASRKSQGNLIFVEVRELSWNFANCQGNLEVLLNVRELKISDPILVTE